MILLPSSGLLLGLVLGLRHAVEPDHLTAVATILSETRSAHRTMLVGAVWGIGHCAAILVVALFLGIFQTDLPPRLEQAFDLLVAVMLLALGARSFHRAFREGVCEEKNLEGGATIEWHSGPKPHLHIGRWSFAPRSLLFGLMHGLAGSGLITALVSAHYANLGARISFVLLFGCGALLGMAALSWALGYPLGRIERRPRLARSVTIVSGGLSATMGIIWGVPALLRLLGCQLFPLPVNGYFKSKARTDQHLLQAHGGALSAAFYHHHHQS